jgi:hypothetical protein
MVGMVVVIGLLCAGICLFIEILPFLLIGLIIFGIVAATVYFARYSSYKNDVVKAEIIGEDPIFERVAENVGYTKGVIQHDHYVYRNVQVGEKISFLVTYRDNTTKRVVCKKGSSFYNVLLTKVPQSDSSDVQPHLRYFSKKKWVTEKKKIEPAMPDLTAVNKSDNWKFKENWEDYPSPDYNAIHTYCEVAFDDSGKTFYYRTRNPELKVGDFVYVPVGYNYEKRIAKIVSMEDFLGSEAPYPLEKTKHIYGKANE